MTDKIQTETDNGPLLTLAAYSGSAGLIEAALYFANNRLAHATMNALKSDREENPRRKEIRGTFAVKALKEAQSQIDAAIALLEMDS